MTTRVPGDLDEFATPSPGPGAYSMGSTVGKAPAFSLKGRTATKKAESMPGPGQYDVSTASKSPAYSLSGRHSSSGVRTASPGPGAYATTGGTGGGPKFSMSGRTGSALGVRNTGAPGPGAYNTTANDSVGKGKPAFSLGGRTSTGGDRVGTPGPGQYTPEGVQPSKPAFSMRGRTSTGGQRDRTPGPGQYETPKSGSGRASSLSGRTPMKRAY
ncbi:hypothetical protein KIPB_003438 [Kipferlia bialata]|uniref:Uncharacterized protein n=1 Tax=Kipferlia bialata TaxID=797122 RepID=A0A391NV87_9EUKA|nr:hypothetical protein KIPB_003438 [Kipferlia bialata]|eukprot:g3438.t1